MPSAAFVHAEQLVSVFPAVVYVPDKHAVHEPLRPVALALPATYVVLMYEPGAHDVTAVARPVLAVVLHTLVTYCEPTVGRRQLATEHEALVPALAPEAL